MKTNFILFFSETRLQNNCLAKKYEKEVKTARLSIVCKALLTLLLAFPFLAPVHSASLSAQEKSTNPSTSQSNAQVEVQKIWNAGKHNAFTDLTYFKQKFYCTFREGTGHIPGKKTGQGDGTVRILSSTDGVLWNSVALLKRNTFDLRDSKISVTPSGRLMIVMGGSIYVNQKLTGRVTQVSFSDENGENFSEPQSIRIDQAVKSDFDWLWRVTWHKGIGYGVVYQLTQKDWTVRLLKTVNGIDYSQVALLDVKNSPNEATVRFAPNGEMNILIRRESGNRAAFFGRSAAPYTKWNWTDLGESLGGPNFIYLPNGSILLGGRVKGKTGLGTLDQQGKFKLVYTLPSAGDNSYPGFCLLKKDLFVSYYSSHESNTSIYFCRFPIPKLEKDLKKQIQCVTK